MIFVKLNKKFPCSSSVLNVILLYMTLYLLNFKFLFVFRKKKLRKPILGWKALYRHISMQVFLFIFFFHFLGQSSRLNFLIKLLLIISPYFSVARKKVISISWFVIRKIKIFFSMLKKLLTSWNSFYSYLMKSIKDPWRHHILKRN